LGGKEWTPGISPGRRRERRRRFSSTGKLGWDKGGEAPHSKRRNTSDPNVSKGGEEEKYHMEGSTEEGRVHSIFNLEGSGMLALEERTNRLHQFLPSGKKRSEGGED